MWFQSLLILAVAFTSVIAQNKIEKCIELVDLEEIEEADADDLESSCPMLLTVFDCIERAVEEEIGISLEDLAQFLEGSKEGDAIQLVLNVRDVLKELCDEDSQLRKDYEVHAECYNRVNALNEDSSCMKHADAAVDAYNAFEDKVQEEVGEDTSIDNRQCMKVAYQIACIGASIKEECGQSALDIFQQILKRIGLFRNAICSEELLETAKTKFVDSLEIDNAQKELYRLALNIKRRRK